MTAFINGGLRNQIGPSNNDNNSISLSKRSGEMVEPQQDLRLPSPQRGRGAAGEGVLYAVAILH